MFPRLISVCVYDRHAAFAFSSGANSRYFRLVRLFAAL
jgi:hypothetical protein